MNVTASPHHNHLLERLKLARERHLAGDLVQATKICRALIDEAPDQPDVLHMLGILAQQLGKTDLALQLFDATVRVEPAFGQAWANRAALLQATGQQQEALISARRALLLEPDLGDALNMAGIILREQRELEESCRHHKKAVASSPDNAGFQQNLAQILEMTGETERAAVAAQKAVTLAPGVAAFHLTLAKILRGAGSIKRAQLACQDALRLDPSYGAAQLEAAHLSLLIGDLKLGFAQMEKRPFHTYDDERLLKLPVWCGEKTEHLLLIAEQGLGDTLHFARYISLIRDRYVRLSLHLPSPLQRLIEFNVPGATSVLPGQQLPSVTAACRIMSLASICATDLDTIPSVCPYLRHHDDWSHAWRDKLTISRHPRIGLAWAGNPFFSKDAKRSIAFEYFKGIVDLMTKGSFVSLQKSPVPYDFRQTKIVDAAPLLEDFADTAGLIEELDLVITVDTAVAHLAGAMGKPVWMLIPFDNDWRWLIAREDSPWYPTMRLFRQTEPGAWGPVIERVAVDLRRFLDGDTTVLQPTPWVGPPLQDNPRALTIVF